VDGPEKLRVAVITPYCGEPLEVLRACHESVLKQTHPCSHFMVADGRASPEVSDWAVEHITLAKPHGDTGNTPRGIGAMSAMNHAYDAVSFLDADNWYYPNHVASMVALHERTGTPICTATRTMHRPDGSLMYVDAAESDGRRHVDTSCLFITRAAYRVLPLWVMMPPQLGPVGDRVIWDAIVASRIACAHNSQATVAFRTQYAVHYKSIGEVPPPGVKTNADTTQKAWRWWNSLPGEARDDWNRYVKSLLG
jgi:hypothetical protein